MSERRLLLPSPPAPQAAGARRAPTATAAALAGPCGQVTRSQIPAAARRGARAFLGVASASATRAGLCRSRPLRLDGGAEARRLAAVAFFFAAARSTTPARVPLLLLVDVGGGVSTPRTFRRGRRAPLPSARGRARPHTRTHAIDGRGSSTGAAASVPLLIGAAVADAAGSPRRLPGGACGRPRPAAVGEPRRARVPRAALACHPDLVQDLLLERRNARRLARRSRSPRGRSRGRLGGVVGVVRCERYSCSSACDMR